MAPKRRKLETEDSGDASNEICVIHFNDSSRQQFTPLTEDRLITLKEIRQQRLKQPDNSPHRMQDVCSQIPDTVEGYGYHRDCYRRFSANLKRLSTDTTAAESCVGRAPRRPSDECERFIFNPSCIFCGKSGNKKVKQAGTWTTQPTCKFEFGGGDRVQIVAEQNNDFELLRRIKGYDLFACEAQYHRTCRADYIKNPSSWKSSNLSAIAEQAALEEAHLNAFSNVCAIIDEHIIHKQSVMKLSSLREHYVDYLQETEFCNPDYRAEKLKAKLIDQYPSKLSFEPIQTGSYLVFNSMIHLGEAVKQAYNLGIADKTKDVALNLKCEIHTAAQTAGQLQWPPTARHLENMDVGLPDELEKFLFLLITGKGKSTASIKTTRLVQSIGQDLCRAATNGQWKLPKHILLCMTLRHLFRSATLTNLINRFGHSENYSFCLELETALAVALQNASELLPIQIIKNPAPPSLFHSDFDNFDQNTASGSVHTSHGIMLQETGPLTEINGQEAAVQSSSDISSDQTTTQRSKDRSFRLEDVQTLTECYVAQRESPPYAFRNWTCAEGEVARNVAKLQNLLWIIARLHWSMTVQRMPGWAGFISSTGDRPSQITTIDYYPVINCPITEYKAIQECLRYAEKATKEAGQKYTITTFDLGVCMKAYPLIWKYPERYKYHIILIGSFHAACAYFKMIGKKMGGSGLSDLLIEAGLITSGSVAGVLSGKQYSRALTCHKILLEALERLLLQVFLSSRGEDQLMQNLTAKSRSVFDNLLDGPTKQSLAAAMEDEAIRDQLHGFSAFKSEVANGRLGKTVQFWLSYMNHIWLVLELLQAVKSNNLMLYTKCLYDMADLFFSYDGHNYSRYLTYFSVFLANVEVTHPGATELLQHGAISVARSMVQGSRCAVDKTIEETFMKHSKSHGGSGGCGAGLTGILNNFNAYQRWVKTTHERAQYVDVTYAKADMQSESHGNREHRDLRRAEIQKGEKRVTIAMNAINNFLNPFTISEHDKLYCISSGAPAPIPIEDDIMVAEIRGKQAKETFITDRLETKEHFFEPVKRLKLKTFQSTTKTVKLKTSQNKIVTYRQHSSVALQLLVKSQTDGAINVQALMKYPLSPVPYSLGTADGYMAKTDKAKGLHFLIKDVSDAHIPADTGTMMVQDSNALFHAMHDIPNNFRQIAHRIFDSMPKNMDFVFSTDMYQEGSIKEMERERRGSSEKLIIGGELTKKPADWKNFLMNSDNKSQLIDVMNEVWCADEFAPKLSQRKVITVVQGHCYILETEDGTTVKKTEIPILYSNQEETDTRIILYCAYAQDHGYDTVRIRSPDSDVFFIALHHAAKFEITMLFDTGAGNKKRLINISELARVYGQQLCTALMSLHAFTHCDTTSAFKGIGKVKPIKLVQKTSRYQDMFCQLGDTWKPSDSLNKDLEEFTCAIYGKPRYDSVDELRFAVLKDKCGGSDGTIDIGRNIDLSKIPPCKNVLLQHIRRTNYQVGIWKAANIPQPVIPEATDGHGWKMINGNLEPEWFHGPVVPADVAEEDSQHVHDGTESSDLESDEDDLIDDTGLSESDSDSD